MNPKLDNKLLPLFFNVKNLPVLVVGGGKVAARKILAFNEAGADITVVSPNFDKSISSISGIKLIRRKFIAADLKRKFRMVILATDNPELHVKIQKLCSRRKIWINRCDDADSSDFVTGSVTRRNPIVMAVIAGNPGIASLVKRNLEKSLDPALVEFAAMMQTIREMAKKRFHDPVARSNFLKKWSSEKFVARIQTENLSALKEEILRCLCS